MPTSTLSPSQPVVALLMPQPRRNDVFAAEALDHLHSFASVIMPGGDSHLLGEQLPEILPRVDACLTGWGAPPFSPELLAQSSRLKIIAHSAGSIKALIPPVAFEQGIVVCHAAEIIAEAVAECALLLMLTGLRRLHLLDRALKAGRSWQDASRIYAGHQLAGRTVGLVGCGKVARQLIRLLQPFGVTILVYDPYLSPDDAARLGVTVAPLEQVLADSAIVSNHAPITPATRHLIGATELSLLADNALFINTARAWTVDEDALLRELQSGRLWAALDVFEEEPLPQISPFRQLENVFLTPHKAGETMETYRKQGMAMVEEVERFFKGEPLKYRVPRDAYAIMA